jgi:hypothetical protein
MKESNETKFTFPTKSELLIRECTALGNSTDLNNWKKLDVEIKRLPDLNE